MTMIPGTPNDKEATMSRSVIYSRRARGLFLGTALAVAASGCDFSVTNPGPLQDANLDKPAAYAALVEGTSMALSRAVSWIGLKSAPIVFELTPAGAGLTWGFSVSEIHGTFIPGTQGDRWTDAHVARWSAEDAVRRFREAMGDQEFGRSPLAARALLNAGYANRLLGENMCHAVIDGGAVQRHTVHFERARAAFGEAIEVAGRANQATLQTAARAGRASVRAWQGDWAGAVADAEQVPEGFSFAAQMSGINNNYGNVIWYTGANEPYRSHTVHGTFFATYHETTQDPRTPWGRSPTHPLTTTNGSAMLPYYYQGKYTSLSSPIKLSSGREMRLIVAEARLRDGQWQQALEIINALRTSTGVPAWEASSAAEAWTALKRERAIELWLEARRLGDIRRWMADSSPGEMPNMQGRSTCFPVPQTEIDRNPNVNESDL
jgi:starch-binding outer membrane protein, SusD/RagB family